ncbi:hypothetical protein DH86_00004228, partial [Scytalidium sp. 3C]
ILKRAFKCITTDEETFNLASKRMKFSDSSLEDDDTTVLTGRVAIDIEVAMEDDLCISSWAWQKELKESVADILKWFVNADRYTNEKSSWQRRAERVNMDDLLEKDIPGYYIEIFRELPK